MNMRKSVLTLGLVVAMLFAFAIPVAAIGFDAEVVYDSVFVIYSGNALGSGFAVGENCIVTNAHVVEDTKDVTVVTCDGDEFPAEVLCWDEGLDIAVLAVDKTLTPLPLKKLSDVKIGEDVCAIGAPKSMAYTLTKGVVSAKERPVSGQTYIQTDAAINEGNSGGPLLDDNGNVIGMNTLKLLEAEGIGLAIPVDRICQFMKDQGITLTETGNVDGRVGKTDLVKPTEPESSQEEDGRTDNGGGFDWNWGEYEYKDLFTQKALLVFALASVGVSGLVAVAVLMIVLRKKKQNKKEEKKEKTLLYMVPGQDVPDEVPDFDIEFLE